MYTRRARNANIATLTMLVAAVMMIIALVYQRQPDAPEVNPTVMPSPEYTPVPQAGPTPDVQVTQSPSAMPSGAADQGGEEPADELHFAGLPMYFVQMGAYTDQNKVTAMQAQCKSIGLSDYVYNDDTRMRVFGDVYLNADEAEGEKQRIESTYNAQAYVKQYTLGAFKIRITADATQTTAIKKAFGEYKRLLSEVIGMKGELSEAGAIKTRCAALAAQAQEAYDALVEQTGHSENTFVSGLRGLLGNLAGDLASIADVGEQDIMAFYAKMKYTVVKCSVEFHIFVLGINTI